MFNYPSYGAAEGKVAMTTLIRASCQCGQLHVTSTVANSKLPLKLYLCACDTCRWLTGCLTLSSVNLHQEIEVSGKTTKYTTSIGPKGLDRCFCPICGTLVYEDSPDPNVIGLYAGAVDNAADVLDFVGSIWTSSTRDGGLTRWMPGYPAWKKNPDGDTIDPSSMRPIAAIPDPDEPLLAECCCGGVSFNISRPSQQSYESSSANADSIVPSYSEDEPKNRANGIKYPASVCACDSCRKSSGQDLVQWAVIPYISILNKSGQQFDFGSEPLRGYVSSKGITRYFCSVCGAIVFWTSEERRSKLIEVAVGLFRSKTGSRAHDWLEWSQEISFVEEGKNREVVDCIRDGLHKWYNDEHGSKLVKA